jgi:hypothetical protein
MAETKVEQKPKAAIPGFKPDGKVMGGNGGAPDKIESKADKWKRLANMRVPKVVKGIRNLSNLSNRISYEYTDEQAAKLVDTLMVELVALKQRFQSKAKADVPANLF